MTFLKLSRLYVDINFFSHLYNIGGKIVRYNIAPVDNMFKKNSWNYKTKIILLILCFNQGKYHQNSQDTPATHQEIKSMLPETKKSNRIAIPNIFKLKSKTKSNEEPKSAYNRLSHHILIIVLGFYFIITTIPFSIVLAFTNQLTLKLNYHLPGQESYLNDETWILYGQFRDYVMLFKLFFISNHCVNFFFYLSFNRKFRKTLVKFLLKFKNIVLCLD